MLAALQVLLPFAVLFALAVLLAVIAKRQRPVWIVTAVLLIPVALGTYFACGRVLPAGDSAQAETVVFGQADAESYLQMASALIAQDNTAGARRILEDYVDDCLISDDYLIASARLEAAEGNFTQAAGIYRQVLGAFPDSALSRELLAVTEAQSGEGSTEAVRLAIETSVGSMHISSAVETAARDYTLLCAMDRSTGEPQTAAYLAEDLEELAQDEPALLGSETMETAYLKALVLSEQYDKILEQSDRYVSAGAQLILAELIRQGDISEDLLENSEYLEEISTRSEQVLDWIQAERDRYDYSEAEAGILSAAEADLEQSARSDLSAFTAWAQTQLRDLADAGDPEASKLYLELSRMYFDEGREDLASEYLRLALLSAGDSGDPAYSGPVSEVNEILEHREDTERLKDVGEYVDMMVDHMEPVEMTASGETVDWDSLDFASAVTDTLTDEDWTYEEAPSDHTWTFGQDAEPDGLLSGLGQALGDSGASTDEDFSQFVSTEVSQLTASISIASLDASNFETVRAVVAIDESLARTPEEFLDNVQLYDCDIEITQYQVEKLDDAAVNIILVCDNSGSMAGQKISDLKAALSTFAGHLDPGVQVGIVAFDSGVIGAASCDLGASQSLLQTAINNMTDLGGTNIYSGVREALDQMHASEAVNVIVVMSDGQDSALSTETMTELSRECADRDVTIYTMGLGSDVDSAVLSGYSDAGGGQYTFVSDSGTLLSFYQYIYQLSRNRFRLTYQAVDTIQAYRTMQVVCKNDVKIHDERDYSLLTSDLGEENLDAEYLVALENVTVGGLDTRLLYKSTQDQTVHLTGEHLTADLSISVSIQAGVSYDLPCERESDSSWRVTVPGRVACGEYHVVVTVNGRRAVFTSGLVVADGQLHTVRFGQYVFTASAIGELDHAVKLSGYVSMNDWLGFTGGVTLTGDRQQDSSLSMQAGSCYVKYQKGDSSLNGVAKVLSETGLVVSVRLPSEVRLYRNEGVSPSSDGFRVDPVVLYTGLNIKNVFTLQAPGMSLYPDRLLINFSQFTTEFPLQKKLLSTSGLDKFFDFSADHEESLIVSPTAVDCKFKLEIKQTDQDAFREAKFCNLRLLLNLNDFEVNLDTSQGDFSVKTVINLMTMSSKLGNSAGFGMELAWAGGNFDTAKIYADFDVDTNISGVPVTFSDFSLGVTGLGDSGLKTMMLEGGCKISAVKISKVLPGIEKFIDDAAVFSLENVALKLRFYDPYISLSANAKFLEFIELGSAQIELGRGISYTNNLIGYDGESVNGMVGQLTVGIKMDVAKCQLDVGGAAQLALTNRVCGLKASGHVIAKWEWWILQDKFETDGQFFIGLYQQHNGSYTFRAKCQSNGGKIYDISWNEGIVIA